MSDKVTSVEQRSIKHGHAEFLMVTAMAAMFASRARLRPGNWWCGVLEVTSISISEASCSMPTLSSCDVTGLDKGVHNAAPGPDDVPLGHSEHKVSAALLYALAKQS
jgi:hypothetical protein